MNKRIIAFFIFALFGHNVNAQTYYYRYTKSIINGKTNNNVSGGQFITFDRRKCFESDKYGNEIGNGVMAYDAENSKQIETYYGSCYWSKNAHMKFNADKSVMNIETNAGKIYVYKRATAPAGVTTSSLICKPKPSSGGSSGGEGGGGYVLPYNPVQPINPQGGYVYEPDKPQKERKRYEQDKPQKTRHICPGCNGAGSIVRNDGSISSYGASGYKKRCSTCGYEYWSTTFHRHETCRICHGRGYREY